MEAQAERLAHALISDATWRCAGLWTRKSSSYEPALCSEVAGLAVVMGDGRIGTRYHDAVFGDAPVEIKKGNRIIVNLVRCAEQVTGVCAEAARPSLTLCLRLGAHKRVREFLIVDSHELARHALGGNSADMLLRMRELSGARDVQCQAFLSWKGLRDIALQQCVF